jgi:hypothetical protein
MEISNLGADGNLIGLTGEREAIRTEGKSTDILSFLSFLSGGVGTSPPFGMSQPKEMMMNQPSIGGNQPLGTPSNWRAEMAKLTDIMTANVATWVTQALSSLDADKLNVVDAVVYGDPDVDLRVVFRLKEGAVVLEGINNSTNQRFELYREDVAPLRFRTGMGEPASKERH